MKRTSLVILTAAAILAAGAAGAAEHATKHAAKPVHSTALKTCKEEGKRGKELSKCVRVERKKEREARLQEKKAKTQEASSDQTEDAQPAK